MLRSSEATPAVQVHVAGGASSMDRFEGLALNLAQHVAESGRDVLVVLGGADVLEHLTLICSPLLDLRAGSSLLTPDVQVWLGHIGCRGLQLRDDASVQPLAAVTMRFTLPSKLVADIGVGLLAIAHWHRDLHARIRREAGAGSVAQ